MSTQVIATENAPAAIGAYVQARVHGNQLWTSGVVAIDPATNKTPDSVEDQTALTLKNLQAIIDAAGFKKTDIVMCNVYLNDIDNDFKKFDTMYSAFFGEHKPCRCTIQSGKLCAPFKIELFVQAVK